MARIVARNAKLFAGARNITGRVNRTTLSFPSDAPEVTTFKTEYRERLGDGLRDGELSFSGMFDGSASQLSETLQDLSGASGWWGWYPEGSTASLVGKEIAGIVTEHDIESAVDGAVLHSGTVNLSSAILAATSLGHTTLSGVGASELGSVDSGSTGISEAFYNFRVLSLTGATPEISASVQGSWDDSAFTTLAEFTAASSGNQITTASVYNYLRYRRGRIMLAGTSPSAEFFLSMGVQVQTSPSTPLYSLDFSKSWNSMYLVGF